MTEAEAAKAFFRKQSGRRILAARRGAWPDEFYVPHSICTRGPRKGRPSGQLQFHKATNRHRWNASGNGVGGTRSLGMEVDAWMRHTNRWQKTPDGPIMAWWYAPDHAQFDDLRRTMLEPECFGNVPIWRDNSPGPRYEWPDGSVLKIKTALTRWQSGQGVEPHLIVFDETPKEKKYLEAGVRSRGTDPTRIIGKATQTEGTSWMADAIYKPWLKVHQDAHIYDEEAMMVAQIDPDLWLWPKGGIHDNPHLSESDVEYYIKFIQQMSRSKNEMLVRLYGGFLSFVGDPVFDEDAMERMREAAARYTPAIRDASIVALTDEEVEAMELEREAARGELPPAAVW